MDLSTRPVAGRGSTKTLFATVNINMAQEAHLQRPTAYTGPAQASLGPPKNPHQRWGQLGASYSC
jgi:hypothetical protein